MKQKTTITIHYYKNKERFIKKLSIPTSQDELIRIDVGKELPRMARDEISVSQTYYLNHLLPK